MSNTREARPPVTGFFFVQGSGKKIFIFCSSSESSIGSEILYSFSWSLFLPVSLASLQPKRGFLSHSV